MSDKLVYAGHVKWPEDWAPLDLLEARVIAESKDCLLYTSPSPRDGLLSRMPSSA